MYLQKHYQVFLLHYAGGNSYSYNFLKQELSEQGVGVYALELPGRGRRLNENFIVNKQEAVNDYVQQIKKIRNESPYLIFGHSMGGTLGFSVVKCMEDLQDSPVCLIVSGNPGPGLEEADVHGQAIKKKLRHLLSDNELKKELISLGGTPAEILGNKAVYDFYSPIIRADFELLEKDTFTERDVKIESSIIAMMGEEEEMVNSIDNWGNFTQGSFISKIFPGKHFFIYQHATELAATIMNCFNVV